MAQSISFQQAVQFAKSGDAGAQYFLSSVLNERKQFDESLHWLRLAAAQRLIPAQLALASFLMDGRHCARDRQQAMALLRPLAATQVQANLLLGELHGFAANGMTDRVVGLSFLFTAARMGDAGALRQLALLCVCHQQRKLVRPLLDASARRGDAIAVFALACCSADGFGGAADAALAAAATRVAAAGGQYLGARLAQALANRNPTASAALSIDWSTLERVLPQLAADLWLPAAKLLNQSPQIRLFSSVLHPLVMDAVINIAAPQVQRSQIVDASTGVARADPMRNSSHITLGPRQHDHLLEAIEGCIGRVTGVLVRHSEFLQILRYRQGEEFRPHVDYFNESGAGAYKSLADGGQRAQTVLLYLNTEYDGGSTDFPELKLSIKGNCGDLLHFHNLGPDGLGCKGTLHAGMPIKTGEKWLLSQWIRRDSYPPRLAW